MKVKQTNKQEKLGMKEYNKYYNEHRPYFDFFVDFVTAFLREHKIKVLCSLDYTYMYIIFLEVDDINITLNDLLTKDLIKTLVDENIVMHTVVKYTSTKYHFYLDTYDPSYLYIFKYKEYKGIKTDNFYLTQKVYKRLSKSS